MDCCYSYEWFKNQSSQLNRAQYKLDAVSSHTIHAIKKQLNICDFNDVRSKHAYEPPKINKPINVLSDLYKLLNKITNKTYEKLSVQILEIIDHEISESHEKSDPICQKFFEVICNNVICCSLYAKLFSEITQKHDKFKTIFRIHVNIYLDNFKEIQYVSPDTDYDAYCDYVKEIDKMNHFTLFLVQCYQYSICGLDDIIQIVLYFQERLLKTIDSEIHSNENEQTMNTMYLILKDIIEDSTLHEEWDSVIENFNTFRASSGKGKSNKMKFKLMDIDDLIRKNT
jgi:hypothetical protein